MSVVVFDDRELCGLRDALARDCRVKVEEAAICLIALGLANRAAYFLTYNDEEGAFYRPDLCGAASEIAKFGDTPADTKRWARNLLYNCITNAGTDFAPTNYAEQLSCWIAALPSHD